MKPIIKDKLPELHEVYKKVDSSKMDTFDELDKIADTLLPYSLAREQGFICCYCMGEIPEVKDREGNIIYGKSKEFGQHEIPMLRMKVEHFRPRSIYNGTKQDSICDGKNKQRSDLRIDYSNLLCACEGCVERELTAEEKENKAGRKFIGGKENTFCDTYKGDTELCYLPNPSDRKEFGRVKFQYNENGVISATDPKVNYEIGGEKDDVTIKKGNELIFKRGVLNLNYETLRTARKAAWITVAKLITRKTGVQNWHDQYNKALEFAKYYHRLYSNKKSDGHYYMYCETIIYLLEKRFRELKK